ncbi:hypothetical protein LJR220_003390 [Bradyrhizobium sp. LjRoot220]|uniref:hypothetical protein n=1 Tax=Bradyrhizobium sp. LjRoot220 TaxID=3342284 RepID=UPI003ECF76DE
MTEISERVSSLKRMAELRCEGCRLSWRLDGWKHREPMPIECQAKEERQQLRDIARSFEKKGTI